MPDQCVHYWLTLIALIAPLIVWVDMIWTIKAGDQLYTP